MDTTETRIDMASAVEMLVEPETEAVEDSVTEDQPEVETEEVEETEVETSEEDSDETADDDAEDSEDSDEDDDEDDELAEADEEAEPTFTVKVDGEQVEVSLSDLKQGYSGQKYVQKGMQEAAEQRKAAAEAYDSLIAQRQQLAELVNMVQEGQVATPPQEPSRELFDSDPIGYMEAKMDYDEKLKHFEAQQSQLQAVMQQETQAEAQARAEYMKAEAKKLVEAVPELEDAANAASFRDTISKAAQAYGYSAEEISGISSHRDLLVLRDAMKYRELMESKTKATQKVKKARPVIKPGAKKTKSRKTEAQKRMEKLRRSNSIDDALALMLEPE